MNYDDPWKILELEKTKDKRAVKKAYAKMIERYHIEENPEMFKQIHLAYEQILDIIKYDLDENNVFNFNETFNNLNKDNELKTNILNIKLIKPNENKDLEIETNYNLLYYNELLTILEFDLAFKSVFIFFLNDRLQSCLENKDYFEKITTEFEKHLDKLDYNLLYYIRDYFEDINTNIFKNSNPCDFTIKVNRQLMKLEEKSTPFFTKPYNIVRSFYILLMFVLFLTLIKLGGNVAYGY